jgi:hypothetical protein
MLRGLGVPFILENCHVSPEGVYPDKIWAAQPVFLAGRVCVDDPVNGFVLIPANTCISRGHFVDCFAAFALIFSKCGSNIIAFHSSIPAK